MSLVLIVEDNERNLKLVRDVLQAKGYATLEAGTAEEGLELARERAPGLILMDIHLPGMSGIEALKALRAEVATASIPVIAITASVMQESLREVMAAGFDDLIEKPINVLGFLDKVRSLLGAAAP
jgi:two-component system cell cycle response regulator DivK